MLASRLGSEDFKQLFLTRSLNRPRLLFATVLRNQKEWIFYSSQQHHNLYEKSYLTVTADILAKSPGLSGHVHEFMYASGLFYFPGEDAARVICNPGSGQYVILPKPRIQSEPTYHLGFDPNLLGFDPINKEFKVVLIRALVNNERVNLILTLGTGEMRWRTIQFPLLPHRPFTKSRGRGRICINGVLYYLAERCHSGNKSYLIVCFNVRNETFKFIDIEYQSHELINYKGKLGMAKFTKVDDGSFELHMWILEDVEEQEWAKYVYPLPKTDLFRKFSYFIHVVGVTSTGEIVLSTSYTCHPFYVYYFNPEKNSFRSVGVKGLEKYHGRIYVFMDYIEDLDVFDVFQGK